MPTRKNKKTLMERLFNTPKEGDDHAETQESKAPAGDLAGENPQPAAEPAAKPAEVGGRRTYTPGKAYISPETGGQVSSDEVLAALAEIEAGFNKLANTIEAQRAVEAAMDEALDNSAYAEEFWKNLNMLSQAEVEARRALTQADLVAVAEEEFKKRSLINAMPWNDKAAAPKAGVANALVTVPKEPAAKGKTKAGKPRKGGTLTLVKNRDYVDFKTLRDEHTQQRVAEIEAARGRS